METVTQGESMVHWMPLEMSGFLSSPLSDMTLSDVQLMRRNWSADLSEAAWTVLKLDYGFESFRLGRLVTSVFQILAFIFPRHSFAFSVRDFHCSSLGNCRLLRLKGRSNSIWSSMHYPIGWIYHLLLLIILWFAYSWQKIGDHTFMRFPPHY